MKEGLGKEDSLFFLAWTTTPWTLPSNTALAVGPEITYCRIRTFNPYTGKSIHVIVAEKLISRWFNEEGKEADMVYEVGDRKSTRLNSSHVAISYADFCLK